MSGKRRLSIDHLTVTDAEPIENIKIAAALGCTDISIIPASGVPQLVLPDILADRAMHRRIADASKEYGIGIYTLEGFMLTPEARASDFHERFEMATTIGAPSGVVIIFDPDLSRAADLFGELCEIGRQHNMRMNIEYVPTTHAPTLQSALDLIERAGSPENAALVVDILHHIRSGGSIEDIARISPSRIATAQICDGPLEASREFYVGTEMILERMVPGQGQFPLRAFIDSLPAETVIGVEVPMAAYQAQGGTARARAERAVTATRSIINQAR
jgi:sugar phosphate isomerase/epimerase